MKTLRRKPAALLILALLIWTGFVFSDDDSVGTPAKPPARKKAVSQDPKTLMELFEGFTRGLNPDFDDPEQVKLFEMYRVSRFGDATPGMIPDDYVKRIQAFRKAHPEIAKKYFSEVTYIRQDFLYPPVAKLTTGKTILSTWQNIQTMRAELGKFLVGDTKALVSDRRLSQKDFTFLFGDDQALLEWKSSQVPREVKLKTVFANLLKLRKQKIESKEPTKFIDQTLLDIANTVGFEKALVDETMKDSEANAHEKLRALRQGIYAREDFAGDMSQFVAKEDIIPGGYKGLVQELGLRKASKLADDGTLVKTFAAVEEELNQKAEKVDGEKLRVRQLSPAEEALRSCLGGDCSSRTYFEKAMEADYVYFTQTNTIHESMGHATLVIGEAEGVKVAMLDKLQNIPNEEIPYFIESLRRSLLQDGYLLGIPDDLGDHNGLSNYEFTRAFVGQELKAYSDSDERLTGFKPHHASINEPVYSRAYKSLSMRIVKPLAKKLREAAKIRTGAKYEPVRMGRSSMDSILAEMRQRKNSTQPADHFEYVHTVMALLRAGVEVDPDYKTALSGWLSDPTAPVSLKNSILRYQLEAARTKPNLVTALVGSLNTLKPQELRTVVQNWSQVSDYRLFMSDYFEHLGPVRAVLAEHHLPIFSRVVDRLEKIFDSDRGFHGWERFLGFSDPTVLKNVPDAERARLAAHLLPHVGSKEEIEKLRVLFSVPSVEVIETMRAKLKLERGETILKGEFDLLTKEGFTLSHIQKRENAVDVFLQIHLTDSEHELAKDLAEQVRLAVSSTRARGSNVPNLYKILRDGPELLRTSPELRDSIASKLEVATDENTFNYMSKQFNVASRINYNCSPAMFFILLQRLDETDADLKPIYYSAITKALPLLGDGPERFELREHLDIYENMLERLLSGNPDKELWATRFFADVGVKYRRELQDRFDKKEEGADLERLRKKQEILVRRLQSADVDTAQDAARALVNARLNGEIPYGDGFGWDTYTSEFVRVLRLGDTRAKKRLLSHMREQDLQKHPELKRAVNGLLSFEQSEEVIKLALDAVLRMDSSNVRALAALFSHPSQKVRESAVRHASYGQSHLLSDEEVDRVAQVIHDRTSASAYAFLISRLKARRGFSQKVLDAILDQVEVKATNPAGDRYSRNVDTEELFKHLSYSEETEKLVAADLARASDERIVKYTNVLTPFSGKYVQRAFAGLLTHRTGILASRQLYHSDDPILLRHVASLLFSPHWNHELSQVLNRAIENEPRSGEVVRKTVRKLLPGLETPEGLRTIEKFFKENAKNVALVSHVGAVVRQNEAVRTHLRNALSKSNVTAMAFVLKPELEEDRAFLEELRAKIGTEEDIQRTKNDLIDYAKRKFPVEGEFYSSLSSLGEPKYWWYFGQKVDAHAPEGIKPAFQELIKRVYLKEQLDGVQDSLHTRVQLDARASGLRAQTPDRCAKALEAMNRL